MNDTKVDQAAHNLMALSLSAMKLAQMIHAQGASVPPAVNTPMDEADIAIKRLQGMLVERQGRRATDFPEPPFVPPLLRKVTPSNHLYDLLALHVQLGEQIVKEHGSKVL